MSSESKKKSRDRLKQDDPVAYEAYLQKERDRNKKRMADPVQYRKLLDKTNRNVAKYKQDPIKKEKIQAAKRQVKLDVKQLRNNLKTLYSSNKNLFTEEQRHLIFDFSSDGKNYICTSKKQLQNIQQQIYLQMEDLCLK